MKGEEIWVNSHQLHQRYEYILLLFLFILKGGKN